MQYPIVKNLIKILLVFFFLGFLDNFVYANSCIGVFPDVSTLHPKCTQIEYLQSKRVMNGYSDGSFKPGGYLTRGQLAKIMVLAFNMSSEQSSHKFPDVNSDNKFAGYIDILYSKQIVSGYSDGLFRPDQFVTRAEYFKYLYNSLNQSNPGLISENWGYSSVESFNDVPFSNKFSNYINVLHRTIDLDTDNNSHQIYPENFITREDASDFLARAMKLSLRPNLPIDATFISLRYGPARYYSQQDWIETFELLVDNGIHTIVVSSAVVESVPDSGTMEIFYPSQIYAPTDTSKLHLPIIFDLADKHNIDVFVSPAEIDNWYSYSNGESRLLELSSRIAKELVKMYNSYTSFKGWYIQPEFFLNENPSDYSPFDELGEIYRSLSYPPKKILASPYFVPTCYPGRARCENQWWTNKSPQEIGDSARLFAQKTQLDIFAPQDGVGASGVNETELVNYLGAMKNSIQSVGKEFWVDMEIFKYNSDKTDFIPTDLATLDMQIRNESNSPVIAWEFVQFMSPKTSGAAKNLYDNYRSEYNISSECQRMYYFNANQNKCVSTTGYYGSNQIQCGVKQGNSCKYNIQNYTSANTNSDCYPDIHTCESTHLN